MNSNMVKPEQLDHLNLVHHFAVPLRWKLKPPKTNKLAYGFIERTSSILDEIESKNMHKDEERDQ